MRLPDPAAVTWDDGLLLAVQLITLGVLIVYVWKTWEMASATRRAAEASERTLAEAAQARLDEIAPAILVYLDSSPFLGAEIVIENAGKGAAADVALHFDPPLRSTEPDDTQQFFDAVQALIPPGYRIAQLFDTWPALLSSDVPKQYLVTVTYRGAQNGQRYEVVHRLDAESLRYRFVGRRKGLNEIAEEIEAFRKSVEERLNRIDKSVSSAGAGPYHARDAADCREAVQRLLGFWHLQKAVVDDPGAFLPYNRMLDTVRSDLVALFRLAPWARLNDEQHEALSAAARVVFGTSSMVMGQTGEWRSETDKAMERVAAAFS